MAESLDLRKAHFQRTAELIRNAASTMSKEEIDEVEHFLSHNELALAFDVVLDELNKTKAPLTAATLEQIDAIAASMDYHPNVLQEIFRLTDKKD